MFRYRLFLHRSTYILSVQLVCSNNFSLTAVILWYLKIIEFTLAERYFPHLFQTHDLTKSKSIKNNCKNTTHSQPAKEQYISNNKAISSGSDGLISFRTSKMPTRSWSKKHEFFTHSCLVFDTDCEIYNNSSFLSKRN